MVLIFGGAYQGKLDYAKRELGVTEVFTCREDSTAPDLSRGCLEHLERFSLACVRAGLEPQKELERLLAQYPDTVLICDDVSCGVVPMEPELRAWREATGRMVNSLAARADKVVRLFCGLPQVLK